MSQKHLQSIIFGGYDGTIMNFLKDIEHYKDKAYVIFRLWSVLSGHISKFHCIILTFIGYFMLEHWKIVIRAQRCPTPRIYLDNTLMA